MFAFLHLLTYDIGYLVHFFTLFLFSHCFKALKALKICFKFRFDFFKPVLGKKNFCFGKQSDSIDAQQSIETEKPHLHFDLAFFAISN